MDWSLEYHSACLYGVGGPRHAARACSSQVPESGPGALQFIPTMRIRASRLSQLPEANLRYPAELPEQIYP